MKKYEKRIQKAKKEKVTRLELDGSDIEDRACRFSCVNSILKILSNSFSVLNTKPV